MSKTKIEWTEDVWNPVTGCTKVSPGCAHCYAERMSKRLKGRYGYPADDPFKVTLHHDRLDQPLHWRKPRTIFVCSMGDLFHEDVPHKFIAQVFNTAMRCHHEGKDHTFIFLTKRPERMATFFREAGQVESQYGFPVNRGGEWTASLTPNVWLGVTAENQEQADKRISILLQIPAAKRFVSIEPMLGPVELEAAWHGYLTGWKTESDHHPQCSGWSNGECDCNGVPVQVQTNKLDWVIVGCESGPGRRRCDNDWIRQVVADCRSAEVPVFVKQIQDKEDKVIKDISQFPADLQVRQRPGVA